MEHKNIIIVLVIVIIILACMIGTILLPSLNAKKDCQLTITSDSSLYEGDNLTVRLTDMNGTPIAKQTVNVTIIDSNGTKNIESVVTDSNGSGMLKLNENPGNYKINCTYGGNENFTSNSTCQDLEIKEVVTAAPQQSSSSSDELTYDSELNVYYNSEGIVVDPDGEHPMEAGTPYSELVARREAWESGELVM